MNPGPPSLYVIALQQCIRYGQYIDDIGMLPYEMVKPILAKFSHEQLADIERKCPHIVEKSDELWREVIMREFKDRKIPKGDFRKSFYDYRRDKEEQLVAARERLKLKQEQYNKNKRAASVIELTEDELPMHQRGVPQPSFKSRTMQSVAKRAQATTQLRRPGSAAGLIPKFFKANSGLRRPVSHLPLRSSPPPPPAPLRASTQTRIYRAASPPTPLPLSSPLRSPPISPPPTQARAAASSASLSSKRRRTPSVFLQRK